MDKKLRKKNVLDIIIRTHIDSAEPVGSKYISDIMELSSATIRNIMGELEADGFLEQPHTSAGRIPTELAYRMYVNALLQERESIIKEIRRINEELFTRYQKYTELIEKASYMISKMTNYTSFSVYPKDHIYMDGTCHIIEQPEFGDLKKIKSILRILDEKEKILNLINSYLEEGGLKIHIGHENSIEGLKNCSIVTASYKIKGKVVGGVGIIGPIRMNYRSMVPLVKHLSESISKVLERYYE